MDVLTTSEMEQADRLTIAAGTPGFALMLSAGQAVVQAAMDLVEQGPIVVVAGRGNNGGGGGAGGTWPRGIRHSAVRARDFDRRRRACGQGLEKSGSAVHPASARDAG